MFIDRERELAFLEEKYSELKLKTQLLVIYGRRRVGKSELLKKFIRGKKAVYFLADKAGAEANFSRFVERVATATGQQGIFFKGWPETFEYLKKQGKLIIVIDEFPYLVKGDASITSVFQRIADEVLLGSQLCLILCGSSISVMEDKVLAYRSPLYGRRTGQWQLSPLSFKQAGLFFPNYKTEQQIEAYAVAGGIPMYLAEFSGTFSVEDNIKHKMLSKGQVLYEEPPFVLNQEFGDARIYISIFEAVAKGKRTVKEISDAIGVDSRNVNKYLNTLIRLQFLSRETPLFSEGNRKKVRYAIKDNFFDFWFKYVNPNLSELELGNVDKVANDIANVFDPFVGKKFEQVTEEALLILNRKKELPFAFDKVARFWDNPKSGPVEIDRIAVNEKEKKLLVVECKWSESVSPKKLLVLAHEKVSKVPSFANYEVFYALFAKSFSQGLNEPQTQLFDLKKLEKIFA